MLNSLQAARAIAALLVVLHHASGSIFCLPKYFGSKPLGPIFEFGFVSVDFFFVLSGFIITHVHARDVGQPAQLGSFLGKRFTRAYFPYWVVMLAILPVYFLIPSFGHGHERNPDVFLSALALLPHPQNQVVLVVSWTMVYETFFYLLFALLIAHKRIGILIMLAWLAGVMVQPFDSFPGTFVVSPYHLRTLAGVAIALIFHRWQTPRPREVAIIGIGVALATSMAHMFYAPLSSPVLTWGCTIGCALGVLGLAEADRRGYVRTPRLLVYLGDATYAIYLVHFPALSVLAKLAKLGRFDEFLPAPVLFLLLVAGSIGMGCLFHHLVENPLHRLTKRLFQKRPQPMAAGSTSQVAITTPLRKVA